MEIWTNIKFKDFFAWQFSDREKQLPEAQEFVATIKKEFKAGSERYYFREEKRWLIHKSKFDLFWKIYSYFIRNMVFKQGEMFK